MPDSLEVIEEVVEILEIAEKGDPGESGAAPLEDLDTLEVQLAATGHRISGLRGLDGVVLVNPFTVLQAGGKGKWGIELPTNRAVQLYHQEADAILADVSRLRYPSIRLFDGALSGTVPEPWQYDDNRVFATITAPGGDNIQPDGTIDITFSEAVTGVTTVGDGTGTLEATDGTGFAPSVSTADNITWTLQPPVGNWIEGANLTITISPTIAASANAARLCDGLGYQLTVAASAPDTEAPIMTGFVVEATSSDANIAVTTISATDDRAVTAYLITESATTPSATDPNWDSASNWITNGYDTGLTVGANQTVTLYAWAKDAADNISTSLTDSCDVNIPAHLPSFSVQPTVNTALYDGATLDFTTADDSGHNLDIQYWDGTAWNALLTNVAAGAQTNVAVTGLTPDATLDYLKLRAADTGTTDWVESNTVASFSTVAPTLSNVTAGDTQNTLTFADHPNDTADSFNIHWGTVSGSLGNTITGVTSPYGHTGLTNDQAYYYEIVAVKGGVESLPSSELSGTPLSDPSSVTSAVLWLDPNDSCYGDAARTTLATDDSTCRSIADKIGTNHSVQDGGATYVPTYRAAEVNGKGILHLTDNNDFHYISDPFDSFIAVADAKFSFHLALTGYPTSGTQPLLYKYSSADGNRQYILRLIDGKVNFVTYGALSGAAYRVYETDAALDGLAHAVSVEIDMSVDTNDGADRVTIRVDGTSVASSMTASVGALFDAIPDSDAPLGIGASVLTTGAPDGVGLGPIKLGSIVIADTPSAQDITDIDTWMKTEWGL